jgi:phage shock protein C
MKSEAIMNQELHRFRSRARRSSNGAVLGVFRGLAESMGWSVFWTRVIGVIVLMSIVGTFGVEGLSRAGVLACSFFYLLLALLMGPARTGEMVDSASWKPDPPCPGAVPRGGNGPRVDLAQLDRQLESLNRRIRRMEAVVTDRQYDWERRLGK